MPTMRTAEIAHRCFGAALAPILSLMLAVMALVTIGDVAQVFGQTGKPMNRPSRVKAPEWYDKVPADDSTLVVRGRADLKDQQVAVDKAVATARSGLAATIDRRWKELLQEIQKEGLIAPERIEESVTLEGSTMIMQKTSKRGRIWTAFVLVALPKSSVRTVLAERLHRDAEWYSKVKDTKAVRAFEDISP